MLTSQMEVRPDGSSGRISGSRTDEMRQAIRDDLARELKDTGSKDRSTHERMEHQGEIAALQALERLLLFLDSMQSTSGRSRQLRDFARLNERTRAARDAKLLAIEAESQ
ncbi:hypothetical protein BAC2_02413 [uncultured bacterium]|nr:hypothetical protein BAC2_02413 [uncultured bacterium]